MADQKKKVSPTVPFSLRIPTDVNDQLTYYADQFNMTKTDLLLMGASHYIKWRQKDYDLPTAEIARLNQLVESQKLMVSSFEQLSQAVTSGFDTMLGLHRGSNYLADDESGSLDE